MESVRNTKNILVDKSEEHEMFFNTNSEALCFLGATIIAVYIYLYTNKYRNISSVISFINILFKIFLYLLV